MTLTQIKPAGLSKPVDLADNEKIRLGTGNDLEIYHDGSNSYLTNSTGGLFIKNTNGSNLDIFSHGSARIRVNAGEMAVDCSHNSSVDLYYDNVKKFETTSSGAKITGEGRITSHLIMNSADNQVIYLGASNDVQLYHSGSNTFFTSSTGDLILNSGGTGSTVFRSRFDSTVFNNAANSQNQLVLDGGMVKLYESGGEKLRTLSTGAKITGQLNFDDGSSTANTNGIGFGSSQDCRVFHDGASFQVRNTTGPVTFITPTRFQISADSSNDTMFKANQDGAVELYYDNSKKLETTSTGIKVDSTSDAIIDLHHNNSTAHCRLNFSNNNGDAHGGVWYSASSNMEFRTSNNERLRITSSGQIWKRQDPVNRTALKTYTGGEGLMFDHYQLQDSGTYIRYSDIVSIGDGSQGSAMRLLTMPNSGTPQERVRIHPTGEVTIPSGVTLGTTIGSNASSNTLDDYEEGTWTPTISSGSGSITVYSAKYTKIGRQVAIQFYITFNNTSNNGNQCAINGLPFTVQSSGWTAAKLSTGYSRTNIHCRTENSSTTLDIKGDADSTVTFAQLHGTWALSSLVYFTDS